MRVSSAYILGMPNDRQADHYYKLETKEDQGSFPVVQHLIVVPQTEAEHRCMRLVKYGRNQSRVRS